MRPSSLFMNPLSAFALISFLAFSRLLGGSLPSIVSGSPWLDQEGKVINAHGGGMLEHNGVYYWYGEMKVGSTVLPDFNANWGGTRVPFSGVSCYSSTDLRTWKYEGNVLPVRADVIDLMPDRVIERPKVIYNAKSREFVMWMHVDSGDYKEAKTGVAVASTPTGPFIYLGGFRPNAGTIPTDMPSQVSKSFHDAAERGLMELWISNHPEWAVWARDFAGGQMARDQSVFVDEDGTAYQFYASEENAVLHISELDPTYRAHAGRYRRILFNSREAPAPFKWQGRYYLITSGCTGWDPNPSRLHTASDLFGPWSDLGDPFCEASTATAVSYLSQPAFVFASPSGDLVLMADRWEKGDLAASTYVWLPFVDMDGAPRLRWMPRWDIRAK